MDILSNIDTGGPLKDDVVRNVFPRAQAVAMNTLNVKQPDKIRPGITAIVFIYTGDLLAADSMNSQLPLLNAKTMKIQATCSYPKPFFYLHLALLNDRSCLSMVPGRNGLQFVKTEPRLKVGDRKMLNKECNAMTATMESIFLLCSSAEKKSSLNDQLMSPLHNRQKSSLDVIVMDHYGIITKTIHWLDFEIKLEPTAYCYMAVRSSVICIAESCKRVYTFNEPDM